MLGFGYADSKSWRVRERGREREDVANFVRIALTSTLDFPTLWRTTVITGREMIGNLVKGKL